MVAYTKLCKIWQPCYVLILKIVNIANGCTDMYLLYTYKRGE